MRKKHFSKIGVIGLVLLAALMLSGVSYGMWSQSIDVSATGEIGTVSAEMTGGLTSENVTWSGPSGAPTSPYLTVNLSTVEAGNYTEYFTLTNNGTIPVKISAIAMSTPSPPLPAGSTISVTGIVAGNQIDPGQSETGQVNIDLAGDVTSSTTFTVGVTVSAWNQ